MCAEGVSVLYRERKPRADRWSMFGRIGSTSAQRVRINTMQVRIRYIKISMEYKITNGGDLLERLTQPGYSSFTSPYQQLPLLWDQRRQWSRQCRRYLARRTWCTDGVALGGVVGSETAPSSNGAVFSVVM